MAIYVDNAKNRYGRMIMCHMMADTSEELMKFAKKLNLDPSYLQSVGTPKEHFDLSSFNRVRAVKLGAVKVSSRDLVRLIRRKRDARRQE